MFVKICGITRDEDARAAVEFGADALGFIFWPDSPRVISAEAARAIIESIPQPVQAVGVFVNQPVSFVNDCVRRAGLTRVQLHGEETPDYAAHVSCPVIKSTTVGRKLADGWPADVLWLIDVHDPQRRGGTGRTVDWAAAAEIAAERRVLLAGGLTPDTISEAIARVRPFGVDVSSGVESAPGKKDRAKLEALFEALHAINHN
jgi:phosphoribosylanthranilate isomerase